MTIDKTAIIDSTARIAAEVSIGPYTIIDAEVEIGEGTVIGPHVVIRGPTVIGKHNQIYQFCSLGEVPQDKKFRGERTILQIGDRNVIREFCTFNRGTALDRGITQIGNDNLFMAYAHIAHDCHIGNYNVFANNASLAGHVEVADYTVLGGFAGVVQFCRLGDYSFAAGGSIIAKDVPPYVKVSGYYAKPFGLNSVGLKRHGFSAHSILALRRAYRVLYGKGLTLEQATSEMRAMAHEHSEVEKLVEFVESSEIGIVR